jgi:hypothetical protein
MGLKPRDRMHLGELDPPSWPSKLTISDCSRVVLEFYGDRAANTRVSRVRRGSSFSGIFEIVTAHEAGGGRAKKETHLRGERRLPPLAPLRRPWPPNLPSHPLPAQGERRGRGTMVNHRVGRLTTRHVATPRMTPVATCRSVLPRPQLRNQVTFDAPLSVPRAAGPGLSRRPLPGQHRRDPGAIIGTHRVRSDHR